MAREIYGMEQQMLALTTKPSAARIPEVPFELPLDKVLAMLLAAEGERERYQELRQ